MSAKTFPHICHPILLLLLSIAFLFAADNIIFRSGWYGLFLNPDAHGGIMYHTMYYEKRRQPSGKKEILLIGNSQIDLAFSIEKFEHDHPDAPIKFIQASVIGTYEKAWYYILKILDPTHERYAGILIPVNNYKINPWIVDRENTPDIVQTLAPIMRLQDWPSLLRSYTDPKALKGAILSCVFSSHGYSLDLQDFFLHPSKRLEQIDNLEKIHDIWRHGGDGWEGSLADIKYDPTTGKVLQCPPQMNYFECKSLEGQLFVQTKDDAQEMTNRNMLYTQYWLNKIMNLYRGSHTRIIFIQLPRWPMPLSAFTPISSAPNIQNLIPKLPNVVFADDNTFTSLEKPEYFHDTAHMNKQGREIFTQLLGKKILELMAPN